MYRNKITKTLLAVTATLMFSNTAMAKDWIEKVSIQPDGIDTKPIVVSAGKNGHKSVKTENHKFLLHVYAKAKKNRRIVAGQVGAYGGVDYFEGKSPSFKYWDAKLSGQAVAGGKKQSISYSFHPTVPVAAISWGDADPVSVCKKLMAKKMSDGMSKSKFLSKSWDTSAYAFFQFDAVATTKKKAKKMNWKINSSTNETKSLNYRVPVKCLAGIKRAAS